MITGKMIAFGMAVSLVGTALASDQVELDQRVRAFTARFESLQSQPDKGIPADILRKAQGLILLERTKAGFMFAYRGGEGLALARDPRTQQWSPAAFVSASEPSWGFQAGGEQDFTVVVILDPRMTSLLAGPNFDFVAEARGTAGNASAGVQDSLTGPRQPVLVYGERLGFYGGAAFKAGKISPDDEANRVYYGQPVTMRDIMFDKKVKPTEASENLTHKITDFSTAAMP
jgi:lipid-binding SYLF domain-containing protein